MSAEGNDEPGKTDFLVRPKEVAEICMRKLANLIHAFVASWFTGQVLLFCPAVDAGKAGAHAADQWLL